jgi:hypothetical protein
MAMCRRLRRRARTKRSREMTRRIAAVSPDA